jgi:H+/Cl- antiporter ClcA
LFNNKTSSMPSLPKILLRLSRFVHWRAWQGRVLVWCAAAVAALVIVAFAQIVDLAIDAFNRLRQISTLLPLLLTPLAGMLIAYLTRRWFAGSEGSGIPQVIATLQMGPATLARQRLISVRNAIGKIVLGTAALACGFSAGREGPSVQVGASLMYAFRKLLPKRFPVHPHHLLLAGGAAGIAAAFNTPLAGIMFAIEELGRKFEERTNGVLLTAIILAGVISISLQGNYTYFGRLAVGEVSSRLFLPILLAGVLGGGFGALFSRLMLAGSAPWSGRIGEWKREHPIQFAGLCGLLVAVLGYVSDGAAHGSGYAYAQQALVGHAPLPFHYAVVKMAATLLSYLAAIPGGIFAPCLAVGAGLGQDLSLLHLAGVGATAWMALGMAAFLAGVTQAPITAFVIVMEMIDGHSMVVSLIAAAFLASLTARLFSPAPYHALAHRYLDRLAKEAAPPA